MEWTQVGQVLLALLPPVLAVITPLVIKWSKEQKWIAKYHLQDEVEKLIRWAVSYVESLAANAKKNGGTALTSAEKLSTAKEFIKNNLPKEAKNMSDDLIIARIEAELKGMEMPVPKDV